MTVLAETVPALFHWSPRDRKAGIIRRGLVPAMAPCLSSERQDLVCLSPTPSCAWSLSGAIRAEKGEPWDLWQVRLADTDEVHVLPFWGGVLREVRVANRIPKSRVWWVGERTR